MTRLVRKFWSTSTPRISSWRAVRTATRDVEESSSKIDADNEGEACHKRHIRRKLRSKSKKGKNEKRRRQARNSPSSSEDRKRSKRHRDISSSSSSSSSSASSDSEWEGYFSHAAVAKVREVLTAARRQAVRKEGEVDEGDEGQKPLQARAYGGQGISFQQTGSAAPPGACFDCHEQGHHKGDAICKVKK
jgi:hypothetical protein